jgi:hypothetical protein
VLKIVQHNSSAIHAASQGKPEVVKLLIEANCRVNVQDDVSISSLLAHTYMLESN